MRFVLRLARDAGVATVCALRGGRSAGGVHAPAQPLALPALLEADRAQARGRRAGRSDEAALVLGAPPERAARAGLRSVGHAPRARSARGTDAGVRLRSPE